MHDFILNSLGSLVPTFPVTFPIQAAVDFAEPVQFLSGVTITLIGPAGPVIRDYESENEARDYEYGGEVDHAAPPF